MDCKSVADATQVQILPSPPLYGGGKEVVKPNGTENNKSCSWIKKNLTFYKKYYIIFI